MTTSVSAFISSEPIDAGASGTSVAGCAVVPMAKPAGASAASASLVGRN